jgi:lysophospholipase L1-like esterase
LQSPHRPAVTFWLRALKRHDSITGVYYHSGGLRAYPEMLEIALKKAYSQAQVTVRNAGISGDTTKGALARLERDVLMHKPHLITVMLGMNDLVGTPLAVFQKNLREIITRCRAAGAEVVRCTQNSVVETPTRPGSKLAEFSQAIRDIAKEQSLDVADCHARFEMVRARDEAE